MPTYAYVARNQDGDTVESIVDAPGRYEALESLRREGLTVIGIDEAGPDGGSGGGSRGKGAAKRHEKKQPRVRASITDKAVFCRQLAICIGAGVPLRESLELISEEVENKGFQAVLRDMVHDLDEGRSFSEAVRNHRQVFSGLFSALVRAAEEAGSMAGTLEYLATSMERSERLARRIRSIVAYPMFVAIFFMIVCIIMTLFVLPRFEAIFGGFDAQLPLITRAVFGFNRALMNNIAYVIAAIVGLIIAFLLVRRSGPGRYRMDRFQLRLPFAGDCIRKLAVARFARNLAIMVRGGVPIATGIEITADVVGNLVLKRSLLSARERIISGDDISTSLAREGVFPHLVVRMVRVGESSGQLPEVLEKVSEMYEDQVEGSLALATSLLEPILICFFGIIITLLVLAIYVPVFSVSTGMH